MSLLSTSIFIAALGSGIIAGVFFMFSAFGMNALKALPPHEGIAAMQSINLVILRSPFMLVFIGTALISVVLGVYALLHLGQPGMMWLLVACALYVLGTFLLTMVANVPLNNELAVLVPTAGESATVWEKYLRDWTLWNHVRTLASLLASAGFIAVLMRGV